MLFLNFTFIVLQNLSSDLLHNTYKPFTLLRKCWLNVWIFRQALTEYPEARKALEKQARDRSVTLQLTAASSRRANRVSRDTSPLDPIGTCTLSPEQLLEWFVYSHRMKTALISKVLSFVSEQ